MIKIKPLLVVSCGLVCGNWAAAATLTDLIVTNNSTANESETTTRGRLQEWSTSSSFTPLSIVGDTVSFTHAMQFYNGYSVPIGGSGAALTHKRNVIFDLAFTVEDATNRGYTLDVNTLLRGYTTGQWLDGTNPNAVTVTGASLSGRIDTDTSDGMDTLGVQLNDLTASTPGVTANDGTPFIHQLGETTRNYEAGSFVGTRSFALRFTSVTSPATNVFLQNNQAGQGSVRFGGANGLAGLDATGQPQVGDNYGNGDLGHFLTIEARFNPIPEPSSSLLLFGAMIGAVSVRRR